MFEPGSLIRGRYLIKRKLGRGAQGTVYEATDQMLRRLVAIKVTDYSGQDEMRTALESEARILANVKHRLLPIVHDYFIEGTYHCVVMEYIAGLDLAEMIRRQGAPFSAVEVINWTGQLLDVLNYLHTRKPPIIHRDIKPQNLKLNGQGEVFLLDFGLAKDMDAGSILSGYTRPYAPLEQRQERRTTPRSDIYALAATLYHLVTGAEPWDALARLKAVESGKPDPLIQAIKADHNVPIKLAQALCQGLSLDPAHRLSSAAQMREALNQPPERLTDQDSTTVIRGQGKAKLSQSSAIKYGTLGQCGGQVSVRFSPDGNQIASGGEAGVMRIWNIHTGKQYELGKLDDKIFSLAFTRDGKHLISAGKRVHLWDIDQKRSTILSVEEVHAIDFSPDGEWLALGLGQSTVNYGIVYIWHRATGAFRRLGHSEGWIRSIAFAPNGKSIATASYDSIDSVCLWNIETGKVRRFGSFDDNVDCVAFSPCGNWLACGGRSLRVWNVSTNRMCQFDADRERLVSLVFYNDSRLISAGRSIRIWDVKNGKNQLMARTNSYINSIALSPDNTSLVTGSSDGTVRLWLV